jgi:hypothetical protein
MKEGRSDIMTLSSENIATEFDSQYSMETYEIMYLVKRPSYEFSLAVPKKHGTHLGEERPLLHLLFKDQLQMPGMTLEISQMKDFFEGLSRLMEYIRTEEARRKEEL